MKDGPTSEVLPFYENIILKSREKELKRKSSASDDYQVSVKGEPLFVIHNVTIENSSGQVNKSFQYDDNLSVKIDFKAQQLIANPIFQLDIIRPDGVICCSSSSNDSGLNIDSLHGRGTITVNLGQLKLVPDVYLLKISVWDKDRIHSYAVRYRDVLRIETENTRFISSAVFIPPVEWALAPFSKAVAKEA